MSNKPVNFYQGAKGTFRIDILGEETESGGESTITYKATHTYAEIKQAIEDGFMPYCIINTDEVLNEYYYLIADSILHVNIALRFFGNERTITIRSNNSVVVEDNESGGSDSGAKAPVFLRITYDPETNTYGNPDKTFSELVNEWGGDFEKDIILIVQIDGQDTYSVRYNGDYILSDVRFVLTNHMIGSGGVMTLYQLTITYNDSNIITATEQSANISIMSLS